MFSAVSVHNAVVSAQCSSICCIDSDSLLLYIRQWIYKLWYDDIWYLDQCMHIKSQELDSHAQVGPFESEHMTCNKVLYLNSLLS